ncbi:hypothetical protein LOTGIDRAFT_210994 [Lottia gigantea]|uniref:SAM domain-containing protein n=1 Tax=Lottia gigantea TaxID=225164 RepID=V4B6A1_LOTGI|nr:hypothetical protein LOTGIDRAFT_210994 [Lottia gigantea]ESO84029.1 hypothetical protein LOTGIDRAFT_210994 [Lottia gigantea]
MSTDRFIAAAQDGYLDLLQSATKRDLNAVDEDGRSATLWAAHNGNLEALRLIVGRGGDVEKADYLGFTALHLASKGGHLDVVCFLVNWGCNLYALDNEQHTALDLAELVDKQDIVKILDTAIDKQNTKNPKKVSKLKEEAIRCSDRNRKLYERLQDEAARKAEKEQRQREAENDFRAPSKRSFIKTLTMRIKGNSNKPKSMHIKNQNYSNMAGVGVAKRVLQKKAMPAGDEGFKVSEMDDSGKRTIRSLQGGHGIISGKSPNVMYMTNRDHPDAENTSNRPALQNVFGMKSTAGWKSKSESDLLFDSGVEDSTYSDPDEDRETPGLFSRPGFGNTAFLGNNAFVNTMMHSFESGSEPNLNGHVSQYEFDQALLENGERGNQSDMNFLPWDQEEVENLDDDEYETEFSALETFLVSSGLYSYTTYFTREEIDLDVLMKLNDSELKEQLGLQLGPRKKLQEAINRRKELINTPKAITDTYL